MQVDFVIPNDIRSDLREEFDANGSRIYKITCRNKNPLLYVTKLSRLIKKNKYDIVHAHGNSCTLALEMYAAKKGGVKVRISHGHSSSCKYKFAHKLMRNIFDKAYTHAFACGQVAGKWLYRDKHYVVINNGIEIKKFKYNPEIRKEYRDKYNMHGKKIIGHIGHFTYTKNHDFLLDVFKELYNRDSKYRLLLIGEGHLKYDIEKKVSNLGLDDVVLFTGKSLEVPQLMQAMDMIVMPSHYEGLPLTLVEAQSACLPCFVSDSVSKEAAITELIQFISLHKTPEEWASVVNALEFENREINSDKMYSQIINEGYSINNNAKRMKELYKQYILQGKK